MRFYVVRSNPSTLKVGEMKLIGTRSFLKAECLLTIKLLYLELLPANLNVLCIQLVRKIIELNSFQRSSRYSSARQDSNLAELL